MELDPMEQGLRRLNIPSPAEVEAELRKTRSRPNPPRQPNQDIDPLELMLHTFLPKK